MLKIQKAFTLIELMVTLTVAGIVFGLVLPSFNKQIINHRSISLGEELISQFNMARVEAIKRGARVSICASSDSTTTTPTCTGDWVDGAIIFVDNATSDQATSVNLGVGANKIIIKSFPKAVANSVITVKNNNVTAVNFVRFTSLGTLARISNSGNPVVVETKATECKGDYLTRITISLSGGIFSQKLGC